MDTKVRSYFIASTTLAPTHFDVSYHSFRYSFDHREIHSKQLRQHFFWR